MHTTYLTEPLANGTQWIAIHNGDWSGDAIISLITKGSHHPIKEVTLPGFVALALGASAVIDDVSCRIENAIDTSETLDEAQGKVEGALDDMLDSIHKSAAKA